MGMADRDESMTSTRLKTISRGKRLPADAAGIRAPDTLWGKIAQKLGLKQF
jgi:hypothetical protein